jgi:hypothetical protein
VFDRSHYEDVLIGRVRQLAPAEEIERRYGAIVDFEKRVTDAGTRIVKVMLHISPEEQKERLMERLDRPDKHWKYNPGDVDERRSGRTTWRPIRRCSSAPRRRRRRGTSSRRTASGTRASPSRRCCSRRWRPSIRRPAADFDVAAEKARLAAT